MTEAGSTDGRRRERPTVVVVGGGISGLTAALRIGQASPPHRADVVLLDGADRLGGKLRAAEVGGVTVDVGAEAMLNLRPEGVSLAEEIGLGERLVHPVAASASLWNRDRLVPLPRTILGVPLDLRSLEEVLSPAGVARAALDAVLPASHVDGDVSVGALMEERFGRELVDRLVDPLLGGVYAGHARELSARATVPQVVGLLGRGRSLSRAAAEAAVPAGHEDPVPVFAGLSEGVAGLAEGVAAAAAGVGVRIETGAMVRGLAARPGGGWQLVVGETRSPRLVAADAVVLATPATASARLLGDVAPEAAWELAGIEYASIAIVTLALSRAGLPELPGSGFLVPPVDGHQIKAATFSSAKWAWLDAAGGDLVLLRCSIGRHREEQVLQVADEDLVERARAELGQALGPLPDLVDAHVQRWGGALPQYAVGHLDRVATIRRVVAGLPGLAVCGAAYDGLGIPACIASADRAAADIAAWLDDWRGRPSDPGTGRG